MGNPRSAILPIERGNDHTPDRLTIAETLQVFHNRRDPEQKTFSQFAADGVDANDRDEELAQPGFPDEASCVEEVLDEFDARPPSNNVPRRLRSALIPETIEKRVAGLKCKRPISEDNSTDA